MAVPCSVRQIDQEPHADAKADHRAGNRQQGKAHEGLVHHEGAQDGENGFFHIAPDAFEESGGAKLRVGMNRHAGDGDLFPSRLHDGFQRIGVVVHHVHTHGRFSGKGAEAAGRVRNIRVRRLAHHPASEMLQLLFHIGKMLRLVDRALPDHHVRLAVQDGTDQRSDVLAPVLIVRVRIDDDVRPASEAAVQTGHEALCQALVLFEVHHMVDAPFPCHLDRVVVAAVVDDEIFDLVHPVQLLRQIV